MAVEMKPGVWKRRDGKLVTVRHKEGNNCPWIGSDGKTRYDDGKWMKHEETAFDLVEWIDVPPRPDPQPDAAEELAAVKDDRDRWTTAVQAEGRVKTLGQELATDRKSTRLNSSHSSVSRMPSSA